MLPEPIAVTMIVVDALDALEVPYAIGGSLASAVHGVMRATMDADLVVDLEMQHVELLAEALGDAFYFHPETMRDAVQHRASFNLIHLETLFKVDIFVAGSGPLDRAQLARRQLHQLSKDPECCAYVTSPEDIILAKLQWYRMGGETSERQWRDVLGVLRVQANRLDREYLTRVAAELGVTGPLGRALEEAGRR